MRSILSLAGINLRTSRIFIIAWLLPLWALLMIFPFAYQDYYPTLESRQEMLGAMAANAGTTALYGIIARPGTVGQVVTWEMGAWVGLLGSVMSVLLSVRWHRGSETTGLGELQRSTGIRPSVPLLAMILSSALVATALGAGSALVLLGVSASIDDVSAAGSLTFGATITLMCLGSVVLSQLVLLLVTDASSLSRVALSTLPAAFMVRAYADVEKLTWLSWFSPLGWREVVSPFGRDDWARVGWLLLVVLSGAALLVALNSRRSFARGLVDARRPTRTRVRRVRGIVGLSALLNLGNIIGWAVTVAILSAFLMSMSGSIQDLVAGEGTTGEVFRDVLGGTAVYEAFIGFICMVGAILVAVASVSVIHSEVAGERGRTVDVIRATGVRRWVPLAGVLAVAAVAACGWLAVLHVAGAAGLALQESTAPGDYTTLAWATWSQSGAVVFFIGAATFILGLSPRGTLLTWLLLAWSAVTALMGEMLGFPDWLIDASPFTHTMTSADSEAGPVLLLLAAGVVFSVAGLLSSSRRQVP